MKTPDTRRVRVELLAAILVLTITSCKTVIDPPPPDPTPTTMSKIEGDGQTGTVGMALPVSLTIQVNDQNGAALSGVAVTFTTADGTLSATTGSTDGSGQASTTWTLGNTAGGQQVQAAVASASSVSQAFAATGTPAAAVTLELSGGNDQFGLVGSVLANPISARVVDQFSNGVSGVDVTFAVTLGGGSMAPTAVVTDASGDAMATWTLGPNAGPNTATATSVGLTGSPVAFTATGSLLSLSNVTPDPLVEGASATLIGTGFSSTPAGNTVMIGGQQAVVLNATDTALSITIPQRDCRPADDVNVTVMVSGQTTNPVSRRLSPASVLSMAIGDHVILAQPNDLCLQFLPDAIGGDEYVIGVGSPAEVNGTVQYALIAQTGAATVPPPADFQPARRDQTRGPGPTLDQLQFIERQQRHDAVETRLRAWERDNLSLAGASTTMRANAVAAFAQVVPNVGDTLQFKVPNVLGNACATSIPITTVVRSVGTRGIIVTDINNPTADSLTQSDIDGFSSRFDVDIQPVLEANFGVLGDLDTNQRVFMVLTHEVNRFTGIAGFVFSGDLFPVVSCASSDLGEIFYGYVPDSLGITGDVTIKSSVVNNMLALIAHEVTHTIQFSRRMAISAPNMDSWQAEGQADLAKELVGHALFTRSPGNEYTSTDITASINAASVGSRSWYEQRFTRLSQYYGWQGGTVKAANTPELCSIFGHSGTPCTTSYFYGSGWALHRYINDRFGPTYTSGAGTGESALQQDWVGGALTGSEQIESLTGMEFDTLFAQYATMLYADGRPIANLPTILQMPSWDMNEIYGGFHSSLSLATTSQTFGAFTENREVRGGSTAYTLVTSPVGPRGALAVRLRQRGADPQPPLGSTMRPQIWVLRVN